MVLIVAADQSGVEDDEIQDGILAVGIAVVDLAGIADHKIPLTGGKGVVGDLHTDGALFDIEQFDLPVPVGDKADIFKFSVPDHEVGGVVSHFVESFHVFSLKSR